MKSTYKLIGVFWDHRPESNTSLEPIDYDPFYLEAGHPDCLFDCIGKRRYITLSKLLAADSEQTVSTLTTQLVDCTGIAVLCDYTPTSQGCVPQRFFRHRVRQILQLLESILPNASITLMRPPDMKLVA
ncbi:hypothetical protein [Bifidobacterium olomucense]|uniref:Uncharacterized protein n=1 Tax=Bifidobacterium olomucense TaxID=2675324 RepID=A0A7Y0EYW2_9BIFI|nr:hypothetical protein [Bifidobacterium sp. DSM 109959]NMM98698.1 hypothetical protein [Bifidobacterium sp. DSM 109959]